MKSVFWRKKDMQEDTVVMGGATQPDSPDMDYCRKVGM